MNGMDTGTLIAIITALGGGATIKYLFDLITGRGKRKIEATVTLTDASERVVRLVQEQADRSATEAREVREQLQATRSELRAARDEIQTLRTKFDQVISAEQSWAQRQGYNDAPILHLVKEG